MGFPWAKSSAIERKYGQYKESQWYSAVSLQAIQDEKVLKLLNHAARNAPHYKRLLNVETLKASLRMQYLQSLPILERSALQRDFRSLLCDSGVGYHGHLHSSGGTTGQPVQYYLDERLRIIGKAMERRGDYEWTHTSPRVRKAVLWGRVHAQKRNFPLVRGLLNKQWKYYAYRASDEDIANIARQLELVRPGVVMGYSSMIGRMAEYLLGKKTAIRPHAVLATAEVLTDETRALAAQAFGCPVYNRYASSEFGLIASECEHGRLHVHSERLFLEIVKDGKPVQPGDTGEIVITDLDNFAFPFVRYATGDVGALSPSPCSCGRGLPVLEKLSGRTADYIATPSGIPVLALETFTAFRLACANREVRRVQLVQPCLDTVIARVVTGPGYSGAIEARIRSMLFELCFAGTGLRSIEFEPVHQLEVAASGKTPFYISWLDEGGRPCHKT